MEKQKYKERKYEVTVTIPIDAMGVVPAGASQPGSVNIVNVPFIAKMITHEIVGVNGLAATFPHNMIQDGQYLIEWRTDQHNYQTAPIMAGAGFGTVYDHIPLSTPQELSAKTTVTVKITNNVQRDSALQVQLVFHGLEPIGPAESS